LYLEAFPSDSPNVIGVHIARLIHRRDGLTEALADQLQHAGIGLLAAFIAHDEERRALDTEPRVVEIPKDLAAALKKAKKAEAFDKLSYTHRKEHVRAINEAKAAETRARRIDKCIDMLKAGKREGV